MQVWLIVAACFFVLACAEVYWRLRKGESFWLALRSWFGRIVDILSG